MFGSHFSLLTAFGSYFEGFLEVTEQKSPQLCAGEAKILRDFILFAQFSLWRYKDALS
jgi:hypothetical protein